MVGEEGGVVQGAAGALAAVGGGEEGGKEDGGVVVMPFEQTEVGKGVDFDRVRALERERGREGLEGGVNTCGSNAGGRKGSGEGGGEGGKKGGCQEGSQKAAAEGEKGEKENDLRKRVRKEGEYHNVVRLVRTAGEWRACEGQGASAKRGHSAGTSGSSSGISSSGGQHVCVKEKGRISMQILLAAAAKMQGWNGGGNSAGGEGVAVGGGEGGRQEGARKW